MLNKCSRSPRVNTPLLLWPQSKLPNLGCIERWDTGHGVTTVRMLTRGVDVKPIAAIHDPLSEHRIAACGVCGDWLDHVPMFDNFSVLQPEQFSDRESGVARLPRQMDVQRNEVAIGQHL